MRIDGRWAMGDGRFLAAVCAGLALLVAGGCMTPGRIAAQLKDDPAIVVLNVGTPWGVQKLVRIGGQQNQVEVKPDGNVVIVPNVQGDAQKPQLIMVPLEVLAGVGSTNEVKTPNPKK